MRLSALVALSSTTYAAREALVTLNIDDRAILRHELQQWKDQFNHIAQELGLLPQIESLNVQEVEDMELQRLLDAKFDVEEASLLNPQAKFSIMNPYALMTNEEFAKMVQVSFNSTHALEYESSSLGITIDLTATEADWSNGKCNPPVRNQGQCGSCWAFSTLGTVESAHCIATGELLDLSEQQAVSCSTNGGSQGCNGGYPPSAIDWMKDGVCLDTAWPYTSGTSGQTGACSVNCEKKALSIGKTITSSGEDQLQSALNVQPVTVVVEAGNSVWRNYKSGVVTHCPGAQSDHAVIAVGFGTSTSDFFKIKNSWGTSWGDNGYMYLQRGVGGKGMCNVAQGISYPEIGRPSNPISVAPLVKPSMNPLAPTTTPKFTTSPKPTKTPKYTTTPKPKTAKLRAYVGGKLRVGNAQLGLEVHVVGEPQAGPSNDQLSAGKPTGP